MAKNNKGKKYGIGKERQLRTGLLLMAMLLTVTAAACSGKPSKPTENLTTTSGAEPAVTEKPEATVKPESTATPKPAGTAFTPSGTEGRVTFTGNTVEVSEAGIGDTVQFGSYEQDNDESNGAEAIEWLVLDKQDGKLLLLSREGLDCKKYNETKKDVTWETCTLREWLNSTFYATAFSTAEQGRIATTKVRNEDSLYGTEGGNDTEDKIFLLSVGEVLNYFDPVFLTRDPARRVRVTAYASEQGGDVSADSGYDENGWWWLRSPGEYAFSAALVRYDGYVDRFGYYVECGFYVVRPAFWFNTEA